MTNSASRVYVSMNPFTGHFYLTKEAKKTLEANVIDICGNCNDINFFKALVHTYYYSELKKLFTITPDNDFTPLACWAYQITQKYISADPVEKQQIQDATLWMRLLFSGNYAEFMLAGTQKNKSAHAILLEHGL